MRGTLFTAWLASIGLVTWHSLAQYKRPPIPSELGATVIVYGTLSLFEGEAAAAAGYLGWGLVIAGVLNLVPRIANVPDPCAQQQAPTTPGKAKVQ